ncbi:MAG: thiolase family protein [Halobacteria archaeon]
MNKVAVAGVGVPLPCGVHKGRTENEMAALAVRAALQDAGLAMADLEGLYAPPPFTPREPLLGLNLQMLAMELRLQPKRMAEVAMGGCSGALAIKFAAQEIALGNLETAVVVAAAREKSVTDEFVLLAMKHRLLPETGMPWVEPLTHQPFLLYSVIPLYAMSARRYMHEFGARPEHFAMAAVRNRRHARRNPDAAFRDPITVEEVLKSRTLSEPITLLQCCAQMDGCAALVLTTETRARKLKKTPVFLRSIGEAHDNSSFVPVDGVAGTVASFVAAKRAAAEAFKRGGLAPKDVDVTDVYAPFAPQELIIPEDLGLLPRGGMVSAIEQGLTDASGDIPINTDGGVTSRGHPWPVTPLYEFVNIVRQLRGEAPNQVSGARIGMVQAEGGMVNSSVVALLERER